MADETTVNRLDSVPVIEYVLVSVVLLFVGVARMQLLWPFLSTRPYPMVPRIGLL